MNKKARKALDESIEVWKHKLTVDEPDNVVMGPHACPLCLVFRDEENGCRGCPIQKETGCNFCALTPYSLVNRARYDWGEGDGTKRQFRNAARKMIKFMESLQ